MLRTEGWGSLAGSGLVGGSSSSDRIARRTLDGEAWREFEIEVENECI